MKSIKGKVKSLILDDNIAEALQLLNNLSIDHSYDNELIGLTAEYQNLKRKELRATISTEDKNLIANRLRFRILEISSLISSELVDRGVENTSTNDEKNSRSEFLKSSLDVVEKAKVEAAILVESVIESITKVDVDKEDLEKIKLEYNKIRSKCFKVAFGGGYSTGKSTLINAILGDKVLPAKILASTAVVTHIEYSTESFAEVALKLPLPKKVSVTITDKIKKKIENSNYSKDNPFLRINISDLKDYLTLDSELDAQEGGLLSPFSSIRVFLNNAALDNKICLIDTAGLFENKQRTLDSIEAISDSHLVIYIISTTQLSSEVDANFLKEKINPHKRDSTIIVINRIDEVNDEKEKNEIIQKGQQLSRYISSGDNGIFFISAKEGLLGKLDQNIKAIERSQIDKFENSLYDFILVNRMYLQITKPVITIFEIVSDIRGSIKTRLEIGRDRINRLEKANGKFEKVIDNNNAKLKEWLNTEEQYFRVIKNKFSEKIKNGLLRHMPREIEDWINTMPIYTDLRVSFKRRRNLERAESLANEINAYLKPRIEEGILNILNNVSNWMKDEENRIRKLFHELTEGINEDLLELDSIVNRIRKIDTDTLIDYRNHNYLPIELPDIHFNNVAIESSLDEFEVNTVLERVLSELPIEELYAEIFEPRGFWDLLLKIILQFFTNIFVSDSSSKIKRKLKRKLEPVIIGKYIKSANNYVSLVIENFSDKIESSSKLVGKSRHTVKSIIHDLKKEESRLKKAIEEQEATLNMRKETHSRISNIIMQLNLFLNR